MPRWRRASPRRPSSIPHSKWVLSSAPTDDGWIEMDFPADVPVRADMPPTLDLPDVVWYDLAHWDSTRYFQMLPWCVSMSQTSMASRELVLEGSSSRLQVIAQALTREPGLRAQCGPVRRPRDWDGSLHPGIGDNDSDSPSLSASRLRRGAESFA